MHLKAPLCTVFIKTIGRLNKNAYGCLKKKKRHHERYLAGERRGDKMDEEPGHNIVTL